MGQSQAKVNIQLHAHDYYSVIIIQWNPSKMDTIGTIDFVRCSEVSLAKGLVVAHAPSIIAASYDKARLWTTKELIRGRSIKSSYARASGDIFRLTVATGC